MHFQISEKAQVQYEALSVELQRTFQKQAHFLVNDIRHPSLHAKKYNEETGIWQARINRSWRFYFVISKSLYYIVSIKKHPK